MGKISEDEITAACRAYDAAYMPPKTSYMAGMRAALSAAYTVRKERKKQKRENRVATAKGLYESGLGSQVSQKPPIPFAPQSIAALNISDTKRSTSNTTVSTWYDKPIELLAPQERKQMMEWVSRQNEPRRAEILKLVELEAAYTVRKARKAAKRAKAKPSILDEEHQDAMGQEMPARSYQSWYGGGQLFNSAQAVPEPAKPEWNGKFEVGKAYRTRDGQKVIINERVAALFPLRGRIGDSLHAWNDEGTWHVVKLRPLDLVGLWED